MDKGYRVRVIGGAIVLFLVICAGFFLYEQWARQRFDASMDARPGPSAPEEMVRRDISVSPTSPVTTAETLETPSEPESADTELPEADKVEAASLQEFLALLDELDKAEVEALLEELTTDVADDSLADDASQAPSAEVSAESPRFMVMDLIESGVATLEVLVVLVEATLDLLPETEQEKYQGMLEKLQTLHATGGAVGVVPMPQGTKGLVFFDKAPSTFLNSLAGSTSENRSVMMLRIEGEEDIIVEPEDATIVE